MGKATLWFHGTNGREGVPHSSWRFTKWLEVMPMTTAMSGTTIEILSNHFCYTWSAYSTGYRQWTSIHSIVQNSRLLWRTMVFDTKDRLHITLPPMASQNELYEYGEKHRRIYFYMSILIPFSVQTNTSYNNRHATSSNAIRENTKISPWFDQAQHVTACQGQAKFAAEAA